MAVPVSWHSGRMPSAETYREIFGEDDFFLEIQDHGMADEEFVRDGMVEISGKTGIPLVATNDCHFHERDDTFAHRVLELLCQDEPRTRTVEAAKNLAADKVMVCAGEPESSLRADPMRPASQ